MDSNLKAVERGMVGVYLLYNENTDQAYVGSGVLGKRKSKHEFLLKNNRHYNSKLQEAYNRDPNFQFIGAVVDVGNEDVNRVAALEIEQEFINDWRGNPLCLNIYGTALATRRGVKASKESIERNREATTKRWQDPDQAKRMITAQNAGRAAMSEEAYALRSERLSVSIKAAYTAGVRVSTAGQVRSEEFRENNRNQIKKKWEDPEYRERQRVGRIGKMVVPKTPMVAEGIQYESMSAAALAHGITVQAARYRLLSKNFPEWKLRT